MRADVIAFVAIIGLLSVACAGGGRGRLDPEAKDHLDRNRAALDRLEYGMTAEAAGAIMGHTPIVPPWVNAWKIGPQRVDNPLDTLEFESPTGDSYRVARYAIELFGNPNCPFVRGEATLRPLIFLEGKLVGWRWSYLESAMQRPLTAEETEFRFGGFCGRAAEESHEPSDSASPRDDQGAPSASNPDTRQ